jgi:hypothetical protein
VIFCPRLESAVQISRLFLTPGPLCTSGSNKCLYGIARLADLAHIEAVITRKNANAAIAA